MPSKQVVAHAATVVRILPPFSLSTTTYLLTYVDVFKRGRGAKKILLGDPLRITLLWVLCVRTLCKFFVVYCTTADHFYIYTIGK